MFTIQAIAIRNLYRSQGLVWPHFVSSTLTFIVQFLYLALTATYGTINIAEIGMANAVSGLVNFLFLYAVLAFTKFVHPKTYRCLQWSDLKNWSIFCKTAVPSFMLMVVEGWSFEITTLVVGLLGSVNLAAQGIVSNIAGILWISCGFGTSMAVAALVGNSMGMKKVKLARKISLEMIFISLALIGIYNLTLNFYPKAVLSFFTKEQAVITQA